jgi:hypothetical protein
LIELTWTTPPSSMRDWLPIALAAVVRYGLLTYDSQS